MGGEMKLIDQVIDVIRKKHYSIRTEDQVIVRDGKGQIDRITMLPEHLKPLLQSHLKRVKIIHEQDLKKGGLGVKSPLDMLQIPN